MAAAKGIKTEEIDIHLKLMPNWYKEKINPVGKVPTIEHNGHLIRESLIAFGERLFWKQEGGSRKWEVIIEVYG